MGNQILVIEDEEGIRENVALLLGFNGYEVETAENGKEGLSKALVKAPDLILCDVMMPHMDGYQVLEAIRNVSTLANVPFIFLTAKADISDVRSGMNAGADDYLIKPFVVDDLLKAVKTRLEKEVRRKAEIHARAELLKRSVEGLTVHEYNTPLTGIIGFTELLLSSYNDFNNHERESILDMIKISAARLKRSLDNNRLCLSLDSLTPAHPMYRYYSTGETVVSEKLILSVFSNVQYRLDTKLTAKINVVESKVSLADYTLMQILDELLDNAVKFTTQSRPVQIDGHIHGTDYELTIISCGIVFQAEHVEHIGPYIQFDRNIYEQQGLGVGLTLVKKLLELNQGRISIKSTEEGITSVKVILPVAGCHQ